MNRYEIEGGHELNGKVLIQGSKNAVLPMMAAAILTDERVVIKGVPEIDDVKCMIRIMNQLGCKIEKEQDDIVIRADSLQSCVISNKESKKMRASILLTGALLGRMNAAKMGMPGGCIIGKRPIDIHLDALSLLGARVRIEEDSIELQAAHLSGTDIFLKKPSVGATENIMLVAALARGNTTIMHAAKEPEIIHLEKMLNAMGAKITGAGSDMIKVTGVSRLHGVEITAPPDRIAAGTYLLAAVGLGGRLILDNAPVNEMTALLQIVHSMGVRYEIDRNWIEVKGNKQYKGISYLKTEPYPGFPTDLQSILITVLTKAKGNSCIMEQIFENRFAVIEELKKMGAHLLIDDQCCFIKGNQKLTGTTLYTKELRGAAALVIAGMMADGKTIVCDNGYLDRGYDNMIEILSRLGAKIISIDETEDK